MSISSSPSEGISVLIVDDEELACRNLRRKLIALGDVCSVDYLMDPAEAVIRLRERPPNLVFLDIRMPRLSGFDVLAHFPETDRPFAAVFCTAYDEYATAAFEVAALDYLVKPVEPLRLAAALARARRYLGPEPSRAAGNSEVRRARSAGFVGWLERVVVRQRGKLEVVELSQVMALSSEAHHAVAYTQNGEHVLESSLAVLEPQLNPQVFVRTHRAHLVHLKFVIQVEGDQVVLANGRVLPISRRRRAALLAQLVRQ